jgi:glutaredoxin 3
MAKIELYSGFLCGYCLAAKRLLNRKGADSEDIKVGFRPERRAEMVERADGRHSLPQIFIDGNHIGSCDELHALDAAGSLILRQKIADHEVTAQMNVPKLSFKTGNTGGHRPERCLFRLAGGQ